MRRKYGWITAGIMLFIIFNVLLVRIDKDDKVDRIAYITDWTTLQKKGYA
ncbi:hypothetical protein RWE15_11605 [Virgibacillus halophilus]|uniref:Uncharacterized protein n=1 Tax=Tigheibacillus halophilus TaxID=361280 RepID=A0ABU5C7B6_9BACI|nr:hypothetical protein [Virgibacillus halophilus]